MSLFVITNSFSLYSKPHSVSLLINFMFHAVFFSSSCFLSALFDFLKVVSVYQSNQHHDPCFFFFHVKQQLILKNSSMLLSVLLNAVLMTVFYISYIPINVLQISAKFFVLQLKCLWTSLCRSGELSRLSDVLLEWRLDFHHHPASYLCV